METNSFILPLSLCSALKEPLLLGTLLGLIYGAFTVNMANKDRISLVLYANKSLKQQLTGLGEKRKSNKLNHISRVELSKPGPINHTHSLKALHRGR
jgi:hypothetical protein